jgi:hypothetical protein
VRRVPRHGVALYSMVLANPGSDDVRKQLCVYAVCLALLNLGSPPVAQAALVATSQAVAAADARTADLALVNSTLAREQVRQQLSALGVDPAAVDARVARLTDSELRSLADRMEQMPAGGDALAVIGIVFVILIILELVGVIDIFKKA